MSSNIRPIKSDNPIDTLLNTKYTAENRKGYVEVGEEKICIPIYYRDFQQDIENFEVRDDDVFLCGFPKTGTTWATETIWLLGNNLDYDRAAAESIFIRFHHLEYVTLFDVKSLWWGYPQYEGFDYINSLPGPRFIKTHLHWSLLPKQIRDGTKNPKIIVTLRDSQDTCVSYYHWCKGVENYTGTLEEWCELFLAGRVNLGCYWSNVLSLWHQRHRPNILFLKYADMKNDYPAQIKRIAEFLNKDVSEDQIKELKEFLSFSNMRKREEKEKEKFLEEIPESRKDVNIARKGEVGSGKLELPEEIFQRFQEWNEKHSISEDIYFE